MTLSGNGKKRSVRKAAERSGKRVGRGKSAGKVPARRGKAELPRSVEVQLATLAAEVPSGREWVHEIKFDGYRLLGYVDQGRVKLVTRRHQDWTHRYRPIVAALESLPVESAIVDGELVALLPSGVSSFQALQNSGNVGATKLVYFAFDLLYLNGVDLRGQPLEERKRRLGELIEAAQDEALQFSQHFDGDGAAIFRESCRVGLEGVISKRRDRPYLPGRTQDWLKVKCLGREELVIGGFTLSTADRRGFGALLVGYWAGDDFIYAGRVGTGFNARSLVEMRRRLEKLRQDQCPFRAVPRKELSPQVKWVQPVLVAEFQFSSWTAAGVLRQPSFQGLREDKAAPEVTRPASLTLAMGKSATR